MDVIVIHGYSSSAKSIRNSLGKALLAANRKRGEGAIMDLKLHYADYLSLDDQVQLEDVAEALYLELTSKGFLEGADRTLRFVVHSTGGLVIRQMLMQYEWMRLRDRVASIVFVAPANFGSPLAHKGKSQLGRLKTIITDNLLGDDSFVSELQFGEVGEQILTDLELAAPRQWLLSDFDLYNDSDGCIYHADGIHASVFTGAKSDSLARIIADLDGTDGVIVTSGAGLNVRRLLLDVVHPDSQRAPDNGWERGSRRKSLPAVPQVVIDDLDHGTILTDADVADMILDALSAETPEDLEALSDRMDNVATARNNGGADQYQQFILNVTDDRGRAVTDYDLTFNVWSRSALHEFGIQTQVGSPLALEALSTEQKRNARIPDVSSTIDKSLRSKAYAHSKRPEFRRFLVNIDELMRQLESDHVLTFSILAESGDHRIHYATTRTNDIVVHPAATSKDPQLFFPNTTTQISVVLDRYSDAEKIVKIKP